MNEPVNNARLLTILRGLLAEPSGCPDDSWRRVVLKLCGPVAKSAGMVVAVDGIDVKATDDGLRNQLRAFFAQSKGPPAQISVPGGVVYNVERGQSSGSAPLHNKIALVTGAAGAIGAGICRGLLAKGALVAAADMAREALDELVNELNPDSLRGRDRDRVMGVTMDVTDGASVSAGFDAVAGAWGGVDIIVVNAGIATVASLTALDIEAFRRLERVNVEGTLLTIAEAGRRLCRQATGGDIILVSTKNVFAPGAQFGAYSATKAAAHQLARIASLELASFDIRVNMVAPDAVFSDGKRKSGLWAEIGPARMKARGLDEKGLEDYYRGRNLLKARVTPDHVSNAVLFFATRQTPTTGATIPVDGGLPDATPR